MSLTPTDHEEDGGQRVAQSARDAATCPPDQQPHAREAG